MKPAPAPPRRLGLLEARRARPAPLQPASFPYALGDRIAGDLIVTGQLAAGRSGHLYQVWSAREWCAYTCKILAPERANSKQDAAALRREAAILRACAHPNIVRCYDVGTHDGMPYMLLDYLEGPSLFDVLESQPQRRLEVSDAVRAAVHVGAALYHLHRRGFVHLDLKPANLLLRDRVPVLIDFDTSRRIQPERRPSRRLGTPPYMAPEQALRGPLTPAADIYGLGALLYELVTGRWVFEDVYEVAGPGGRPVQFPQVDTEPPSPARFRRDIPDSLERSIMACLATEPDERYPTMHPLLLALVSELEEPVALWPEGIRAERRNEPRD